MGCRQDPKILIDFVTELNETEACPRWMNLEPVFTGITDLTRTRLQQLKQPTVFIMLIVVSHQLRIELPLEQLTIGDRALVSASLRQKFRQSLINESFFVLSVTVPVNNLVAKPLATPTHAITNTCRADANTRRLDWL